MHCVFKRDAGARCPASAPHLAEKKVVRGEGFGRAAYAAGRAV